MNRGHQLSLLLVLAGSVAGCVETRSASGARLAAGPPPNSSASTWQMPWQILPSWDARQAGKQQTVLAWVPETGFVRGTPTALAGIGRPLEPAPGRNRTVDACRDVVKSEADKLGAKEVEVASAGPDTRDKKGHYVAPVRVRVTYASALSYEVREAMMTCIVDRRLKIVDAYANESYASLQTRTSSR